MRWKQVGRGLTRVASAGWLAFALANRLAAPASAAEPAPPTSVCPLCDGLIGSFLDVVTGVLFFVALVWGTVLLFQGMFYTLDATPGRRDAAMHKFKWAVGGFLLWVFLRAALFEGGILTQMIGMVGNEILGVETGGN